MTTGYIEMNVRLNGALGGESAADGHVTKRTGRPDSLRRPRQQEESGGLC